MIQSPAGATGSAPCRFLDVERQQRSVGIASHATRHRGAGPATEPALLLSHLVAAVTPGAPRGDHCRKGRAASVRSDRRVTRASAGRSDSDAPSDSDAWISSHASVNNDAASALALRREAAVPFRRVAVAECARPRRRGRTTRSVRSPARTVGELLLDVTSGWGIALLPSSVADRHAMPALQAARCTGAVDVEHEV
jgi:hypothetical protein